MYYFFYTCFTENEIIFEKQFGFRAWNFVDLSKTFDIEIPEKYRKV